MTQQPQELEKRLEKLLEEHSMDANVPILATFISKEKELSKEEGRREVLAISTESVEEGWEKIFDEIYQKYFLTGEILPRAANEIKFFIDKLLQERSKEGDNEEAEMNRKLQATMMWIADYAYRKANPEGKMDTPSIVYEQVARDFGKFWDSLTPATPLKEEPK